MPFISGHAMFNPITPGGEQALITAYELPHGRNTKKNAVNAFPLEEPKNIILRSDTTKKVEKV